MNNTCKILILVSVIVLLILIGTIVYNCLNKNKENIEDKYINNKIKNYKFIHISKTGGTSIEEFGKKLGLKWGRFDPIYKSKKNNHFHDILNFYDKNIFYKYIWFTIVRNPYDRIISELNYLVKIGLIKKNNIDINIHLNKILLNMFKDNKLNLNFHKDSNNKDLAYYMHFIPMYFYTCFECNNLDENNKLINNNIKVLKFENLNKEMNNFLKELNVNEIFNIKENISEKNFVFEDLSIKNLKLINEIYKKDFLLFNYKIFDYININE